MKGAAVYCRWLREDGKYEVHLMTSKAKINKLGTKNTPRSAQLLATVVGALHETQPIRKAMVIGDSNTVMGARCRDSAPFSKWYGNHIAETW